MQELAADENATIRKLFDPLVAEDKSVATAEELCKDFLVKMKRLKISHATKRAQLQKTLKSIRRYIDELLVDLEG